MARVEAVARADRELFDRLKERLATTRLVDRARLAREWERLAARRDRGSDFEAAVARLTDAIDASAAKVAALAALPLQLVYDPALPITAHREQILAALADHPVLILCGATGSGKSTQLPKLCLEAGRGTHGLIGHTQPRRIAARAIAQRVASELSTVVGGAVGYQVRFNEQIGPDCRLKFMTDGILLKELESDRLLHRYDTLIIDEAHERSLNIDVLLGVLKRILAHRVELKLIVTSATIDPQRFADFFGGAPIIEVSGRSHPVEVRYRPLVAEDEEAVELSLPEGVVAAVRELDTVARGDVLVFLPGEKHIRECAEALTRAKFAHTDILPLYSRLATRDQDRIFESHAERRIVLTTNVAETSLTVPGIRHVIDSGLARISRYSVRGKVQRLPIEKISKASAEQRKGRCGREAEGICIRLFSEEDFAAREEFTPPEVLRTNLASVILRLAVLGLGAPNEFAFIDAPDARLINDGYRLLQELKAVDAERNVTALGRQIARLPIDPRLARMLIAASHHACLAEMLVIAAFLEIQDPREQPSEAQVQADQAHAVFADPRSDFIAVLNLWKAFHEQAALVSGNQLRKWCREHFLSFVRMREWQELHRQLGEAIEDLELRINTTPAEYSDLHQAILTGFLGQIGVLDEKREYLGARGSRFVIASGTPLAAKPPKWVVAASLIETTRIYARIVASIEPHWIERVGQHLLKRNYTEPHWVEHRGFVAAFESVSLYGLLLVGQRRVNYGAVAPKEAREIFVREALVEGRSQLRAEFLRHNAQLRKDVELLEAKSRRRDILVDEQALCDFYLQRLPEDVHSIAALEKWLRQRTRSPLGEAARGESDLRMSLSDLVRRDISDMTQDQYPDSLVVAGNRLPITYMFEPGNQDDGATLTVPQPLIGALCEEQLAWAIPGWRLERVIAVLRALPKECRRHFVPVPESAARCLRELGESLSTPSLAAWITRESGQTTTVEELARLPIPEHLRINIRVLNLDGQVIEQSRDLATLRRRAVRVLSAERSAGQIYRSWEFGDVPEHCRVERRGIAFTVYPALEDVRSGVKLVECSAREAAERLMRRGLIRLAVLALPQQAKFLERQFVEQRELILLTAGVGAQHELVQQYVDRVFSECFVLDTLPRTRIDFERWLNAHRAQIGAAADRTLAHCIEVLRSLRTIRQSLAAHTAPQYQSARADVEAQLSKLTPPNFLSALPSELFANLPRYLRAVQRRLDKLSANPKRDAELMKALAPFMSAAEQLAGQRPVQPELDKLRLMIEEYRVSLFAQELKTIIPVSDKRLERQLQLARLEAQS